MGFASQVHAGIFQKVLDMLRKIWRSIELPVVLQIQGLCSWGLSAFHDTVPAAYLRWKSKKYGEESGFHVTMQCSYALRFVALGRQCPSYSAKDEDKDGSSMKRRAEDAASDYFHGRLHAVAYERRCVQSRSIQKFLKKRITPTRVRQKQNVQQQGFPRGHPP